MASRPAPPGVQPPQAEPPEWISPTEAVIDERLEETRRQVKLVDLAAGVLGLIAAVLVYLLVAALLDHWLVPGGLGFVGRLILFLGLVALAGYYFVHRILPLVVFQVNPVFAAYTIEQSRPTLKNSLINFLLLRKHRQEFSRNILDRRIYEGLEHTAAAEVVQVPSDAVVDRSQVIRLGYFLAAVLAVCCLYLVLSPKNPLVSFSRVVWPWADIQPPTRVSITSVEPGDTIAFQGDTLTVSAEVTGLEEGETPTLYYTTADKQSVNQAIPMTVPEGGYRYQCDLPPEQAGLQQNVTYYLRAGDALTRHYTVDVRTALAIVVDRVDYDYPAYTGIADKTAEGSGDLRAIEGTRVTIHAMANQEIDQAVVEMDADPRQALRMNAEGKAATAQFRLLMRSDDPTQPQHESYQIRFSDPYGHANRRPIRHQIEVILDRAPEVQFVNPPPEEIQLPENGSLELKVRAEDRDFALRRVALRAEHEKKSLPIGFLLDKPYPEKAHQGPFEGTYDFQPQKLGLKAGDRVIYWAEALDNKEDENGPASNRAETERRWITIVPPDPQEQPQQPQEQPQEGQQGGRPKPQPGQQQQEQRPDPAQRNPGDQGQQGDQPGEKQSPEGQPPNAQDQNAQDQPAGQEQQPGQEGQGASSGDQRGQASGQNGQGAEQQDGQPQSGEPQPGEQQSGEQKQPPSGGEGQQGQGDRSAGQQDQPGAGHKAGQPGAQEGTPPPEPIDPESNPGDAFEEILKHRQQQEQRSKGGQGGESKPQAGQGEPGQPKPDQVPPGQPGDQPSPGAQGGQGGPSHGQPPPGPQSPQGQGGQAGQPDAMGERQPSGQPPQGEGQPRGQGQGDDRPQPGAADQQPHGDPRGAPKDGQGSSGPQAGQDQRAPDTPQPGAEKVAPGQKPEAGQGGQTKNTAPLDQEGQRQAGQGEEKPEAKGGDPQSAQGPGGKGQEKPAGESTGAPSPQEGNQPRGKKPGDQAAAGQEQGQSARSPTTSPKQSDSQGDTAGDRSGGGEEGGGQKSDQSGVGAAGSHTESEQGAGQAKQPGEGETGTKPGEQAQADRPTGQSAKSDDPGPGSRQQPGGQEPDGQKPGSQQPGGQKPGGQQSGGPQSQGQQQAPPDGAQPSADQPDGPPQGKTPDAQGPQGAGRSPMGGGQEGHEETTPPPERGTLGADEVNRQFAEEAVNLSLEYLEDQLAKEKPDPELLDRLGWTRDDLEKFYRQWQGMRQAANQSGPDAQEAREEWNKALQSLGLRSGSTELESGKTPTDQLRDLRGSRRIEPPPGWRELFRAYTESVAGQKSRE